MEFLKKKEPLEPVLLTDGMAREIDALLQQDGFARAVKLVRDRTGLGLVAANNAGIARADKPT